jgi:hypothetical protein
MGFWTDDGRTHEIAIRTLLSLNAAFAPVSPFDGLIAKAKAKALLPPFGATTTTP